MTNKKWTYKKLEITPIEFNKLLELGEDGWEVIGFIKDSGVETYLLKKEIW